MQESGPKENPPIRTSRLLFTTPPSPFLCLWQGEKPSDKLGEGRNAEVWEAPWGRGRIRGLSFSLGTLSALSKTLPEMTER